VSLCPPDSPATEPEPQDSGERIEELRGILLRGDESYLTETVKSVLAEATVLRVDESKEQMASALAPLMGDAIRQQIQTAQEDIIDALYPVIGKAIKRSVAEAMRALARRVDEGLRNTLSVRRVLVRIRARLQGIPESELLLREALPFQVQEVFLIHRTSGLLLEHLSQRLVEEPDRDLVSSMLTAIRDFAQDTFGTDREGELDQIQYGSASILIAPGPWAYLAVVVDGVEPADLRDEMRGVLSDVHRAFLPELQAYDGDAASLAGVAAAPPRLGFLSAGQAGCGQARTVAGGSAGRCDPGVVRRACMSCGLAPDLGAFDPDTNGDCTAQDHCYPYMDAQPERYAAPDVDGPPESHR
jgi:hypothetical protein